MTKFNILLVMGLFLGLVLLVSSIEIYDTTIQYIIFVIVVGILLVLINFLLNP